MLSSPKPLIVLTVLVSEGVGVGRGLRTHAERTERAGDRHIDGKTLPVRPEGEGDVPGATTGGGTEDTELLGDGVKEGLPTKVEDQVADAVVPDNHVPVPCAAGGMITPRIKSLLAQRTRERLTDNRDPKAEGDGAPKTLGTHDGVHTVLRRREAVTKAPA